MTPPPISVAESMRPVEKPADSKINRDLLGVMEGASFGWIALLHIAIAFVVAAGATWVYQVYKGLGIAGYTHPLFWGVYIVTFVFWVGIAHAGTLISAILYLFRAKWRNAINRGAEAMTVFAVLTAAQFLGIHVGRMWKSYFILPYPNQRGLWVNFRSPLEWDTFAISTYATISIVFFFIGLIPDLAIARDRATGLRKLIHHLRSGYAALPRLCGELTRLVQHDLLSLLRRVHGEQFLRTALDVVRARVVVVRDEDTERAFVLLHGAIDLRVARLPPAAIDARAKLLRLGAVAKPIGQFLHQDQRRVPVLRPDVFLDRPAQHLALRAPVQDPARII